MTSGWSSIPGSAKRPLSPRGWKRPTRPLKEKGLAYEREGALFFARLIFGDDKDRVLIKADESYTYLASDVAYHLDKAGRGFSTLVDVWGADHHGYEQRIRSVFKAFGL